MRSMAAPARRRASASATARRSGSRRSSASRARSTAPDATSMASCWGSRSYSSSAIAKLSATPAAQAVVRAHQPAVDGRTGQRPARPIHAGDAEEAQEGPFLAQRRRCTGPRAPGPGQRLGAVRQPLDRVDGRGLAAHVGKDTGPDSATDRPRETVQRNALHVDADVRPHEPGSAPLRAGWPIQTWPSAKRSAFQIGARALVSSMA